jgi:hypothetical protein
MDAHHAQLPSGDSACPAGAPALVGGRGMLALLIVLVGSAALWAALWPGTAPPRGERATASESSEPPPVIEKRFTKSAAPVICRGPTPVVERFEVVNDTREPVVVKDIQRSCGCLDAKLSKQRLEPGETAELEMRVEMSPRGERRTVAANVVTDTAGYWRFELLVRGYPLLQFPQDIEHLNAGDVQPGGELVKQVTLYTHALEPGSPPEIARAAAEAPGARIEFVNGAVERADEGVLRRPVQVTLRIPPERLAGRYTKTARFELRGAQAEGTPGAERKGAAPPPDALPGGPDIDKTAGASVPLPSPLPGEEKEEPAAPAAAESAEGSTEVRWSYSWLVVSRYEVNPKRVVLRVSGESGIAPRVHAIVVRHARNAAPARIRAVECEAPWLRAALDPADSAVASRITLEPIASRLPYDSSYSEVRAILDDPVERCLVVPCIVLNGPVSSQEAGRGP